MDKPAKVTEAELAVLEALWTAGPATVRQLSGLVYPGGGATEYGTVHKLLERLEGKNCVGRDRRGRECLFRATVQRDELIGRELEALVDKMCGGSLQPLVTHLIRAKGLTSQELQELQDLIEELSRVAEPRRRRRKGAD
jgi:BlaI family transcriptional regulator, penicillinase repressor